GIPSCKRRSATRRNRGSEETPPAARNGDGQPLWGMAVAAGSRRPRGKRKLVRSGRLAGRLGQVSKGSSAPHVAGGTILGRVPWRCLVQARLRRCGALGGLRGAHRV